MEYYTLPIGRRDNECLLLPNVKLPNQNISSSGNSQKIYFSSSEIIFDEFSDKIISNPKDSIQ